ncbi:MAG: hypothetical protein AAF386_02845 [Pseudomonadota bacterium]
MNRRSFLTSLSALLALPAVPTVGGSAAVLSVRPEVPSLARFWAYNMTRHCGTCTPLMLQTALNVSKAEAEGYVKVLTDEGVIGPGMGHASAVQNTPPRSTPKRQRSVVWLDNHARMPWSRLAAYA